MKWLAGCMRKAKKFHFWMNPGTVKLATVHSFKGWESRALVVHIAKARRPAERSAVYVALSRLKRSPAGSFLTVVCSAPDYPGFISGWEFPGQKGVPDARRRFEVLWSVDPPAVRDAALICAQITRTLLPGLDLRPEDLPGGAPPGSADLHRAIGLFARMASYLDRRTDR